MLENLGDIAGGYPYIRVGGTTQNILTDDQAQYMDANHKGAPVPTFKGNLLDHHHITSLLYWHSILGEQVADLRAWRNKLHFRTHPLASSPPTIKW